MGGYGYIPPPPPKKKKKIKKRKTERERGGGERKRREKRADGVNKGHLIPGVGSKYMGAQSSTFCFISKGE